MVENKVSFAHMSQKQKKDNVKKKKDPFARFLVEFESLVYILILALTIRAFAIETFRIPTGSMADTLRGAHFRTRCHQCGKKYNFGFVPEFYGLPAHKVTNSPVNPMPTRCPSCGFLQPTGGSDPISGGDTIIVVKAIYQFFEPKRWDVIVFKNPTDPRENYIKRLVGLPGEKVEVIDGDVYINDQIARKPKRVQKELWHPIFNNNFIPAKPHQGSFNGQSWQPPFDLNNSKWTTSDQNPAALTLKSDDDKYHTVKYGSNRQFDFKAALAYNRIEYYTSLPFASDLKFTADVQTTDNSAFALTLGKYDAIYTAWVDLQGKIIFTKISNEFGTQTLKKFDTSAFDHKNPVPIEFANVDHLLLLKVADKTFQYDLGTAPDSLANAQQNTAPQVEIVGKGNVTLSNIALYRDIHYTSKPPSSSYSTQGVKGSPITLGDDEFFPMGDNSPASLDGRWWSQKGKGNNGKEYRLGVVPREYLIGKAMVVFWPAGYKPFKKSPIACIPDFSRIRFIVGGANKTIADTN
jgi:signal peptidase I